MEKQTQAKVILVTVSVFAGALLCGLLCLVARHG